jgi:hypothetical protein
VFELCTADTNAMGDGNISQLLWEYSDPYRDICLQNRMWKVLKVRYVIIGVPSY